LKDVLDQDVYENAYKYVNAPQMYSPASASRRACLKGSPGGECFMGYSDNLLYVPTLKKRQTHPQLTAPSVHHWQNYRGLWPIVHNMEDVLRDNLKHYWAGQGD
jgi:hypothetical protein